MKLFKKKKPPKMGWLEWKAQYIKVQDDTYISNKYGVVGIRYMVQQYEYYLNT